jgi:AcrR family transcriptional regulator
MTAPTRRERLRNATLSEIKDGARRLLVTGGTQAISLRAIAREMGMTAPAIYRYFPSLDGLIAALAGDLYDEMRETIEHERDEAGDDPIAQLVAMARAFRQWSVTHPVEFALLFGSPLESGSTLPEDCIDHTHPGARFGQTFMGPFLELWRRARFPTPSREVIEARLGDQLEPLRLSHGNIPVEVAYIFLSGWTRLYGMVAMEVFNHLQWALTRPQSFFELELEAFARQLTGGGPSAGPADG